MSALVTPRPVGGRVLMLMTTTSYRAGAFLDAARRIGAPVVVGSDQPQALEGSNPAGHLTLDFHEPIRSASVVVEYSRRHPIAAVVAADDDGVLVAAHAAAALGLDHNSPEAVAAARDKLRMREVLRAAGLPGPGYASMSLEDDPDRVAEALRYPCVLKPLSLSASRGVIRADGPEEFIAAFRRVSALLARIAPSPDGLPGRILIEDYLPGAEVALEGLLADGRLRTLAIFDKPDPLEGPFFEETIYVTPSRLPADLQTAVSVEAQAVASALGLHDGPIHAEFRLADRGPVVLEIAPRPIGGLCSRALRFGAGVSLEELLLRHALGEDVSSLEREAQAAGVMMIPITRAGRLCAVSGVIEARNIPGVEEIRISVPLGQHVVPLPEGSRYLGFIFARDQVPGRVEADLREAHRTLAFEIVPDPDRLAEDSSRPRQRIPT